MSITEPWRKLIEFLKEEHKRREEELLKAEGLVEAVKTLSHEPWEKADAHIAEVVTKLARVTKADVIFVFETLLTLISHIEAKVNGLWEAIQELASVNEKLASKIGELEKAWRDRESMLKDLEEIIARTRKFYEENR